MLADLKQRAPSTLTAEDIMAHEVLRLPETMPIHEAGRLLLSNQVSGAPVVNAAGECVGVLTSIDALRLLQARADPCRTVAAKPPLACAFQRHVRDHDQQEHQACTLPEGACPLQQLHRDSMNEVILACNDPHCILTDWQVVESQDVAQDEVRNFMTPDPVTASPTTAMPRLARMMVDAHIHRIVIVNDGGFPIGIVSSTDVLAAVAERFAP